MKKKILIVGGTGFVGKNLVEYFEKNQPDYIVYAPTSHELNILDEIDIGKYLIENEFDVVIHAAVYNPRVDSKKKASMELENDLRMFYNFERHSDLFGKMLYFGSGAEFDKRKDISLIDEDVKSNGIPHTPYGFSKYIINKSIVKSDNIVNLRIFGLYGKHEQKYKTFISGACCKAILDLPLTIRQNTLFDYLYISDFCRIVDWFVKNDAKYKDYNLCTGKPVDLISLMNIILKVSGKDLQLFVCNEGLGFEYTASNKRLLNEIGVFEFTSHQDAIRELYRWYQQRKHEINKMSLLYQ